MKKRFYLFGFLLLMVFDTLAQISFKYAGDQALPVAASAAWLVRVFSQPWVYGAVVGYIGAFFTWMALLKHAPIGPAFAASHLEVVSVMLLSIWLFNEHLTVARWWVTSARSSPGWPCSSMPRSDRPSPRHIWKSSR